ncbi:MAG: ISNCY family transposase [Bacillota bacterium]|jgi:transposase
MSQKQLNRFAVISKLVDGHITVAEAAASLGLCERQVKRIKKGVMEEGASYLSHKNTNRKPKHAFNQETINQIISLKQSDTYSSANFLHFQELLEEQKNIKISYSSLYSILKNAGIQSPKKRRRFKPHRRRKRKPQEGLLIQMDATPFEWFGTNEKFSLHGGIDDATGKIVGLYLTKNECLHGYLEVTKQIICNHGIPVSIYADRHAIFLSRNVSKLSIEDQLSGKVVNDTQFGRAASELGITLIAARSPQAKGRVERLWETLQSRLPVEFKIANITTIDQANNFLVSYIEKFNRKFVVEAENSEIAFRPLPENLDINTILCVKLTRVIDNGSVFSFYNKHFKIVMDNKSNPLPPKTKINVLVSPAFGIKAQFEDAIFEVLPFIKPKNLTEKQAASKSKKPWSPPDSHYFKYGHTLVKKLTFEESDSEILNMLENIFLKKYA